jgi:hypothetical protein
MEINTNAELTAVTKQPKLETFYLLFLVNHNTKEFMLRVENTPGTGPHSIAWFAAHGAIRKDEQALPYIKERYQWVIANCKELEQSVLLTMEAVDSKSARAKIKEQRRSIARSLMAAGYKLYNK